MEDNEVPPASAAPLPHRPPRRPQAHLPLLRPLLPDHHWQPSSASAPVSRNGDPLTDVGKVTERFRRPNFGTLEIEVTIDDPKAYTKPFTVRVQQRIMLNTELIEFICEDRDATHYVGGK